MDRLDKMINQSEKASAWLAGAPRALAVGIDKGRLVLDLSTGVVVLRNKRGQTMIKS